MSDTDPGMTHDGDPAVTEGAKDEMTHDDQTETDSGVKPAMTHDAQPTMTHDSDT